MSEVVEEPAWRRRAVERSTRAAKLRAEQRVERFLDAAQELMAEKETTDFTVQEVVDRSKQSLRSFYQHFDGKHELLLALFEDALVEGAAEIRQAAAEHREPLPRLRAAVETLYAQCSPPPGPRGPLFSDFGLQLLARHPPQVAAAHRPLLDIFTELVEEGVRAGAVRPCRARRQAAMMMQTVIFVAQNNAPAGGHGVPMTAAEVWRFCLHGVSGAAE
ncbi:TetR/AcrR family transcriptional regulator [Actinomadura sp. WMMB 499]|uniref:TetR/AcrR family transcriptional regulator n=1 Tax=Actinomadura sp. WMMB 499 TaxID=1219491 RepID=UPI0012457926|nr:TetR/AcrR family transcriptional regulator [Actinomadura sp. WMMB 499]QFG26087.1 TetR/AcrR family transcriptional regulator [Actinomadura sp. WMMB 499]